MHRIEQIEENEQQVIEEPDISRISAPIIQSPTKRVQTQIDDGDDVMMYQERLQAIEAEILGMDMTYLM